uniref:protein-serine/threonine phosphatase n=3 Tax=Dendroctonus ponderosae TaxID=77166 RepID=A0AAR5PFW2_DENPD
MTDPKIFRHFNVSRAKTLIRNAVEIFCLHKYPVGMRRAPRFVLKPTRSTTVLQHQVEMEIDNRTEPVGDQSEKEFRENLVQEILNKSITCHDNQSHIFSRLLTSEAINSINTNVSLLTDHLVLTSAACISADIIEALGVTCVINAAPELPDMPCGRHVIYQKVAINDSPHSDIAQFFDHIADIIEEVASMRGRTLVFCVAGVSRSASLCMAYLMKHHQLTLLEAYNYVKFRRPRIKPNCGFFQQLIEYEKTMFISNTVTMVFNEFVHMNIPDVYDSEYKVERNLNRKFRHKYTH